MTQKYILTASVAAIALAAGIFAVTGDAFAKGGGNNGSNGSSQSSKSSGSSSSSMKMSSSSHKPHHHHRRPTVISGSVDGCDGYIRNGVCIEDNDDDDED
jgi:hypothetical protein